MISSNRWRRSTCGRVRAGLASFREPVRAIVDLARGQMRFRRFQPRAVFLARLQPGPPPEVGHSGRSPCREVPTGEHLEGVVTSGPCLGGDPLVEVGVGVLLGAHGAAADDGGEFGVHQQASDPLAGGGDPVSFECGPELTARLRSTRYGPGDHLVRSGQGSGVQAVVAIEAGAGGIDTRTGEGDEPPQIPGGDVVPGGTQDVGAQDGALVEGGVHRRAGRRPRPLRHRPTGIAVILGLHRRQMPDDLSRIAALAGQKQAVAPAPGYPVVRVASNGNPLRVV